MEKPNITPTPWGFHKDSPTKNIVSGQLYWFSGKDGQTILEAQHGNFGTVKEDEATRNAQAIVTAVNCTYGASLNPEKIQGLIEVCESFLKAVTDQEIIVYPNTEDETNHAWELEKALNNIKYK